MYGQAGAGLTEQPADQAVLHEMVSGQRQYAEARRLAELQSTGISNEEKAEIQRRRAESGERSKAAALAASRASSARSEVQAALERRRAASESVQPDAIPNDASAAVEPPPPPTVTENNRGNITAPARESKSAAPQAAATLGAEERQAIQRRREASAEKRRLASSEDTRASAAKTELQAALERRRAASDCDAAEAQAAEDRVGAQTPTQVSEPNDELERGGSLQNASSTDAPMATKQDNSQVSLTSSQPALHTAVAETAGTQRHLKHDAIIKDGFLEAPCREADLQSEQQSHDPFKATQAAPSTWWLPLRRYCAECLVRSTGSRL